MSSEVPTPPTTCSRCGNQNRAAARFCDGCGLHLQAVYPAIDPSLRPIAASESELKYGSVLFADVVGSTEMVADRTPEAAREMLLPAVTVMADAVEAFGGTLNQQLGDGVMALFGVPISQEDHALRACCAALRMHQAAATLASPARLRIGIASGLALFGAGEAGAHSAFGATIHLASRLQVLAEPGATLVTASTVGLTGAAIRSKSLGRHTLRGFTVKQEVFSLSGLEPEGTRFSNTVARGLSPLVGRAGELEQLIVHLNSVRAGTPVRVGLVGEAGVGKSRLAWELARHARAQGWHVVQAGAISYGRDIPFQLVANLLCSVFAIADRTATAVAAATVRARLVEMGNPDLSAAAVLSLLDLPLDADMVAWTALQPLQRRQAVDGTLAALLDELFGERAILIVIEDLQWADDESLRLVDLMLATEGRLMLLSTIRPEIMTSLPGPDLPWPTRWTELIALSHLELDSMVKLLVQAFPGITDPDTRQVLIARSGGNPFFLEELARDTLRLLPADRAGSPDAVPPTVQAVVAARIDRLDPAAKSLLVTASAFGTRFPARLLQAMAGRRRDIRVPLDTLVNAGLLLSMPNAESEITFSHALIQDVAYAGLPRLQRRDLHARIVGAIKRVDADQLPGMAETLTYHAGRGEVWDELIVVAGTAGDRAAGRSAYGEAARFYNQAIEASAQLRRTPDIVRAEVDLRFRLRSAIFPTAAIARSLNNSLVAEGLARSIGDSKRLGWATAYVAKDLQLIGRPGEALEAAARTATMATEEPNLLIAARYFAAQAHYSKGNYAETAEAMRAVIDLLTESDPALVVGTPGPTIFFCHLWLTWAEARRGRFRHAEQAADVMCRHAETANSPLFHTLAGLSAGFAFAIEGRFPEAEHRLRRSIDLSRRWDISAWFMNIAAALGHVLSRRGAHADGLHLLGEAVTRTRDTGILVGHAHELAWQAEAYLLAGQQAAAEQCAREAVDQARHHEERGNQAAAHLILAETLLGLGNSQAARKEARAALLLARACGMQPTVARCDILLETLGGTTSCMTDGSNEGDAA